MRTEHGNESVDDPETFYSPFETEPNRASSVVIQRRSGITIGMAEVARVELASSPHEIRGEPFSRTRSGNNIN